MMTTMTIREDYPTCEEFPALTGKQSPAILREAPGDHADGEKAIKLARRAGVKPFPWQEHEIRAINARRPDGMWVHSDAVLICPRQNGKSLLVALIVIFRIFVLGQNVLFTAQRWETAKELWEHTWKIVKSRKWLMKHHESHTCSQGRGTIFVKNGGRVVFTTRSQDAGRGLTKVDLMIFDEAYNLTDAEIAALAFLSQAAPDPQVFYMTSAVHRDFSQHQNGQVISSMRHQAINDWDAANPLYFSEYAAPEGWDPEDEATWRAANPSYGVISNAKKMRNIMRRMNTEAGRINFGVEALGWGKWFDPVGGDDFTPLLDLSVWEALEDAAPVVVGEHALAVNATPDAKLFSAVSASQTSRGVHLTLAPAMEFHRQEVSALVCRAVDQNDPIAIVMNDAGPESTLVDLLLASGLEASLLSGAKVSEAFELFMQMVGEGRITHDGNARWLDALGVAVERSRGGRFRSFDPFVGDCSALIAASFAVWALARFERAMGLSVAPLRRTPAAPPQAVRCVGGMSAVEVDSMAF